MADALNRFRIDNKVALVTGGAAGIGRATAAFLAEAGAEVTILDIDAGAVSETAKALGVNGLALDVTDETAVVDTFSAIAGNHGQIDIIVNNAGINRRRPALDGSLEDWNAVVTVNMTGCFLCARTAARHMPASGGAVINTASIMGFSGGGLYPNVSYATTKGALVNMTRALAVEWAERNIRVNAVAPTWTKTEFIRPLLDNPELMARMEAMTPMRRLAEPEEVAAAILFLASPAASMVTGHTLAVDGGFLAQ